MDDRGPDAQPASGENLVPHQREQRADQQRRPGPGVAQNLGRQEIDDALAPAGALDDEQPLPLVSGQVNGLPMPVAELGRRGKHSLQGGQVWPPLSTAR